MLSGIVRGRNNFYFVQNDEFGEEMELLMAYDFRIFFFEQVKSLIRATTVLKPTLSTLKSAENS